MGSKAGKGTTTVEHMVEEEEEEEEVALEPGVRSPSITRCVSVGVAVASVTWGDKPKGVVLPHSPGGHVEVTVRVASQGGGVYDPPPLQASLAGVGHVVMVS